MKSLIQKYNKEHEKLIKTTNAENDEIKQVKDKYSNAKNLHFKTMNKISSGIEKVSLKAIDNNIKNKIQNIKLNGKDFESYSENVKLDLQEILEKLKPVLNGNSSEFRSLFDRFNSRIVVNDNYARINTYYTYVINGYWEEGDSEYDIRIDIYENSIKIQIDEELFDRVFEVEYIQELGLNYYEILIEFYEDTRLKLF